MVTKANPPHKLIHPTASAVAALLAMSKTSSGRSAEFRTLLA
jgi:hypothetical protein